MPTVPDDLEDMIRANDKLFKALVVLLALKDDHLLEEMRTVFAAALQSGNPIGMVDQPTWAHIRKELTMIGRLVEHVEMNEASVDLRADVN